METVRARGIVLRVLLRHGAHETAALHRLLDQAQRRHAAGAERHHRLREEHRPPQRKDSNHVRHRPVRLTLHVCHREPAFSEEIDGAELARRRAYKRLSWLALALGASLAAAVVPDVGEKVFDLLLHFDHPASHL